jgi:RNA polymerase sigma-70 factor (ECF subfamily)
MTFDEIYEEYADTVYSFLRYKIRDVHLAEDILQDTFLAAYREMTAGRLPERPKAWLLTIAHRRMVDRLRRIPSSETALEDGMEADVRDNGESAAEALHIKQLLGRLDAPSRTILYALYAEGLTIRETAEMLGIPEGTVKSRCHSAKSKLSVWMKGGDTGGS